MRYPFLQLRCLRFATIAYLLASVTWSIAAYGDAAHVPDATEREPEENIATNSDRPTRLTQAPSARRRRSNYNPRSQPSTPRRRNRSTAASRARRQDQLLLAGVPDMFGDFFGGRPRNGPNGQGGGPPRGGAGTRTIKLAENFGAQPRNRLFATFHHFDDVFGDSTGDVNRYVLGFESTLGSDNDSIEVRLPFAHTISNVQIDDPQIQKNNEIGNLTISTKHVLTRTRRTVFSGGVGITLPTAQNSILVRGSDRRKLLEVSNESVHLLPYLGIAHVATPRTFFQSFLQFDFALNGNPAFGDINGNPFQSLGVLQDSALLFLDASIGHWVYRNPNTYVTAVAPIAELHYTTSLQDADLIARSGFLIGDLANRFDILNATIGLHIELENHVTLRPGLALPLRDGPDGQFDYELFLQFNFYP